MRRKKSWEEGDPRRELLQARGPGVLDADGRTWLAKSRRGDGQNRMGLAKPRRGDGQNRKSRKQACS